MFLLSEVLIVKQFIRLVVIKNKAAGLLPVSGDEVLQLQQSVFTVLHHLVSVQMLHQTGQDPAGSPTQIHISNTECSIFRLLQMFATHRTFSLTFPES